MKVIIAGSRKFDNYELLKLKMDEFLKNQKNDVTIISGNAKGADRLGEKYARSRGFKLEKYIPNWDDVDGKPDREVGENPDGSLYWKYAGYERNKDMVNDADALVAFWDKVSRGTKHIIDYAKQKELAIRIVYF
jgi:hypothetical protein